jgi:hypothetical protein
MSLILICLPDIDKVAIRLCKQNGSHYFCGKQSPNTTADMKKIKLFFAIGFALTLFSTQNFASTPKSVDKPEYEIHSMMLYNFTKYVYWPANYASGDFVIGVVGDKNVYETLNKWYGSKSKGAQKISIKFFKSGSEISDCHVLYVGRSNSGDFNLIKTKLTGKSTLLITNKAGMGKKGSIINFKTVDNKLKFELNQAAAEGAKLKVASQLSGMAIVI